MEWKFYNLQSVPHQTRPSNFTFDKFKIGRNSFVIIGRQNCLYIRQVLHSKSIQTTSKLMSCPLSTPHRRKGRKHLLGCFKSDVLGSLSAILMKNCLSQLFLGRYLFILLIKGFFKKNNIIWRQFWCFGFKKGGIFDQRALPCTGAKAFQGFPAHLAGWVN